MHIGASSHGAPKMLGKEAQNRGDRIQTCSQTEFREDKSAEVDQLPFYSDQTHGRGLDPSKLSPFIS